MTEYRGIEVGKPYDGVIKKVPEMVKFNFTKSGAQIIISINEPTNEEIEDIRTGKVYLGMLMYKTPPIIFVLMKFGRMATMDAPYHVDLSKPFNIKDLGEDIGYATTVVLMDTKTIVKVIRLIAMPTELSRAFNEMIQKQKGTFDAEKHDRAISEIYRNYSTEALMELATMYDVEKNTQVEVEDILG